MSEPCRFADCATFAIRRDKCDPAQSPVTGDQSVRRLETLTICAA